MKQRLILGLVFFALAIHVKAKSVLIEDGQNDSINSRDSVPAKSGMLHIGAGSESLTIDGQLEDSFWSSANVMVLRKPETALSENGGEVRSAVRGRFLCFSGRLPESERVVAFSTGVNPAWEREDLLVWRFKFQSPETHKTVFATLAVNAFGAVSLLAGDSHYHGSIGDDVINSAKRQIGIHGAKINGDDFFNAAGSPIKWANEILVAAALGEKEWTVELALPLERLDSIGFMTVSRVRAPRPEIPELTWYWPAENVRGQYKLAKSNASAAPLFKATNLSLNEWQDKPSAPSDTLAREVAELPREVWSKQDQKSLGTATMLEKSIRGRVAAFAEAEKQAWQKVKTTSDWEHFRDKRIQALHQWIGPLPERTPLNALVTRRLNYGDGFVIENLVFESRPHFLVTANLYLPEKISGQIPAIVVVHAHHAPKTQLELQDLGMTWARSGVAVLIMDQICAGERSQAQVRWTRESYYGRYATGNQLYLAGESLIKWMGWDIMRGIDLLTERPAIDPKRIVLLGAVAGGGDPAAFTANLDPRIAAVIPFNFGEAGPEEHYTDGPRKYEFQTADPGWGSWETTRHLPFSISKQFFPWFLCAASAPHRFIFSFEIGWPGTVEEEPAWARYKKVYELYGQRNNLAEIDGVGPYPGAGETNQVSVYLRQQIDPILNRWLQVPIPQKEYHNMRPESELMCLTPETAVQYKPESVSTLAAQLARQRLALGRSNRAGLDDNNRKKALREELKQKLGDIDPMRISKVRSLWTRQYSGFSMEALTINTEPGITLPVFLLKPRNGAKKHAVALAIAEGGKGNFLTLRSNEIAALLHNGITICLPDLRGNGELSGQQSRGPEAMDLAATELMLGRTMTGARLKDTRAIIQWLASRADVNPQSIGIWGDSFSSPNVQNFQFDQSPGQQPGPVPQRQAEPLGPFLALLAGLYEDKVAAIAGSGGLASFMSVLEDRFCQIPQDIIVPGLLEVTDLDEIISAVAPRPVFLEKLVDGRNKRISPDAIEKKYNKKPVNLSLGNNNDGTSPVAWLSGQLLKNQ